MSLWTPSGEHPIDDSSRTPAGPPPRQGGGPAGGGSGPGPGAPGPDGPGTGDPGAGDPEVEALRRQLADAPAEVVVANHCYGLFELAAVYLSQSPPRLDGARLAIDALGALVEGLEGRLGEAHAALKDALAQLRLAFVQISSAAEGGDGAPSPAASGSN